MKITAKVQFVIDDSVLGISAGQEVDVPLDTGDIEDCARCVIYEVTDALEDKYGAVFEYTPDDSEDGDFTITNLEEILTEIKFDEFSSKTSL